MSKYNKIQILVILLTLTYTTSIVQAQTANTPPQIYYEGVVTGDAGTYTFTYNVIAGSANITKWHLKGTLFEKSDINIDIIAEDEADSAESFIPLYIHNPSTGTLELDHTSDHKFNASLTREYQITLYSKDYTGILVDEIEYEIKWPPGEPLTGTIQGPIESTVIIDDTPWYQQLPVLIIPIILLIIGIIAYRQKII